MLCVVVITTFVTQLNERVVSLKYVCDLGLFHSYVCHGMFPFKGGGAEMIEQPLPKLNNTSYKICGHDLSNLYFLATELRNYSQATVELSCSDKLNF